MAMMNVWLRMLHTWEARKEGSRASKKEIWNLHNPSQSPLLRRWAFRYDLLNSCNLFVEATYPPDIRYDGKC